MKKKKGGTKDAVSSAPGLPPGFLKLLGDSPLPEKERLVRSLEEEPVTSLKINRRKISAQNSHILGYEGLRPVKWCESGFYLSERPLFTLNPLLHAGVFYVQEAASMIYETLVRELVPHLPDGPVLDLCAAPGGKTTSIINAIDDDRHIVANEFNPKRANILAENLQKWGYEPVMVTNSPTSVFAGIKDSFALVAVDAPCSGEGMMRKEMVARSQWNEGLVRQCAGLQQQILKDAADALMEGGYMIYSTCTLNTLENEDNLRKLIEEYGLEPVIPPVPEEWNIPKEVTGKYPALRFMPHLTDSEGLFVTIVRKPGNSVTKNWERIHKLISQKCRVLLDGIDTPSCPKIDVDTDTALRYLRRESIVLPSDSPLGMVMITFNGFPLGPAKNLGNRANNLYPKEWRIKNL